MRSYLKEKLEGHI
jgi:hypothetical protein